MAPDHNAARIECRFDSWIEFDPTNPSNVWATFSTFNTATSGTGFGHVFKSTDGGATWVLADGNQTPGNLNAIPDIPAHSVAIDPANSNRIYVGTDLGVFVSTDGGANWFKETTGFSNTPVESLQILTNGGVSTLYAFTHGRSAFKVTIPASCVTPSSTTINASPGGASGTIQVNKNPAATQACTWNAVSNSPFITVSASTNLSGTDTGSFVYTVAPNNTGTSRSGSITVGGAVITVNQSIPTAAGVTVEGRIVSSNGSAVRGLTVSLKAPDGTLRTVKVGTSGNFRFADVPAGGVYTITPSAKSYRFMPESRVLDLSDNATGIDFSAVRNR